jgi:hypothetical protein
MAFICLNVFGPAEGFRAFRITQGSVTPDTSDQLALSSAEAEVSEGAEVYRLLQKRDPSGKLFFELSIFRQVYEFRARRLGHTMGASILFDTSYPGGAEVVYFLRTILDELSAKCCTEPGVFGTLESLRSFCEGLSVSVTETLIPAFTKPDNLRLVVDSFGLVYQRTLSAVVHSAAGELDSTVRVFLDEFFSSIGSISAGRILFFDPKTVLATREVQNISSARDLEGLALDLIHHTVNELRSNQSKSEVTIDALKADLESISVRNTQLSQQLTQSTGYIQQLEAKFRDISTKYQQATQLRNDTVGGQQGLSGRRENQALDNSQEVRAQLSAIDKSLKAIYSRFPEPRSLIEDVTVWTVAVLFGSFLVFCMSLLANYLHSK